MNGGRKEIRIFWTLSSENDLASGDDGKSRYPGFLGQDCAYGDPRDKPPSKSEREFCPYSRKREKM